VVAAAHCVRLGAQFGLRRHLVPSGERL
jgi:hypothetical protein